MKCRPDLVDDRSPAGLEVFQLTTEEIPSSHVYMEAQIFTPDSRFFLLHRSAHAHGSDRDDPEHRYLVCDVENGCSLSPLTHETGATAPSVTPDGSHVYYFVDETEPGGGRLSLVRVALDGTDRRTLLVLDSPIPGTDFRASRPYPLSTISSDGRRLALPAFLGDGEHEGSPYGLLVFDLDALSVTVPLFGTSWCNIHPQYCRSLDRDASHDILIQENHGSAYDASGKITGLVGGAGADIHVIRDDGSSFRSMPWGRDGAEFCQGHQCWRGNSTAAITSTYGTSGDDRQMLVEGTPAPDAGHVGVNTPGGWRNELSRSFQTPHFCHFGTDAAGALIATDYCPRDTMHLYVAGLPPEKGAPMAACTYLLDSRSRQAKDSHVHPFLSPDGTMVFFNSNESGILQAYMAESWA
ncbi:MAG: PD40 domain-containing protein [Planctomycetes bacterium]|nr:PD40 domain-containing protein [Planctomycetota bacterium]